LQISCFSHKFDLSLLTETTTKTKQVMAQYFRFRFNGETYEGRASYRNTRNGFAHDITVHDSNYREVTEATCHYLNSTWECYTYESVLHRAIENLEKEAVENEIRRFKEEANISRLPKGAREQIEAKWHEEYKMAVKSVERL